jgi:tetratricopeptide (TPR) repeat protein
MNAILICAQNRKCFVNLRDWMPKRIEERRINGVCNAGLFRAALHEVYIPRIQRENTFFAANVLNARGALLSVLAHFFENGSWASPFERAAEGENLTVEDQLFVLMQVAQYIPATRGPGAPEARICCERAESLCHSLHHPRLLCLAVKGLWRFSIMTEKPSVALPIAERVYSLAQEQDDPTLMIGAYNALAGTLLYLSEFESARQYAMRAVQLWRSGSVQSHPEDFDTPVVGCLCYQAMSEWYLGETAACRANINEAISLAKELKDTNALALALNWAASLGYRERNPARVGQLAADLMELSTRHNFVYFLAVGVIYSGWARSVSGDPAEGIEWIEQGIGDFRATGAVRGLSLYLSLKAESLHLADRTSEALEAINEAERLAERFEDRVSGAILHRLRAVFLAALGAGETQIQSSFCEAIRIAKEQKSISMVKTAEATYAEYCRQRASGSDHRFRLPLS